MLGLRVNLSDLALPQRRPARESVIGSLTSGEGFHSKIVREIHQFVVEVSPIQG